MEASDLIRHITESQRISKNIESILGDVDYPQKNEELENFPYSDWSKLRTDMTFGRILEQKFSFTYPTKIYNTIVTKSEIIQLRFTMFLTYFIPLLSLVIAFTNSFWYLLGIAYFFRGTYKTKKVFNNVILKYSVEFEEVFSILYMLRIINLITPDYKTVYYYGMEEKE